MRILMLTQWFDPEPMFKGLPFAKKLQERGHDVEVLTGFPNYPGGKIYKGYRIRPWKRENLEGVRVNRVAMYPSHDQSGVRRILNYLSFGLSSLFLGPFLVRKPDAIYVYNLITLAWAACFLRWVYGCPIVYDVQDLWPESVASSGMMKNRFVLNMLKRWSLWAYQKADQIVVLSPGFKQNLVSRGIPEQRIKVIYNWCDLPPACSDGSEKGSLVRNYGLEKTFNVVFAGTMGVMQGLDVVIDAARICTDREPNVRFILVGDGIEKTRIEKRAEEFDLRNIVFIPRQPMSEMGKIFSLADTLLVHLKQDELFKITIPSKTQAYLAAGKPIIMAVDGDAAELIEKARCGVKCPPGDPESLASTAISFSAMSSEELREMGENGYSYYREKLSIDRGIENFDSLFQKVTENKKASQGGRFAKLIMDYGLVVPGLVLVAPILACLACMIRLRLGSPVLFRQVRPGLNGRAFTMNKFRTMTDERDLAGDMLPDEKRLTRFGRFLRSTSLDELPALFNVLKGDMSLVGPRPLLMEYLERYTTEQARRHEVRPGITGWAQVNGRNAISWEEKFKLDVWYVDNRSLWLDLKILWMTFAKVFKREGINQEGQATMEKFMGSQKEG